jgi:hypothetical protein
MDKEEMQRRILQEEDYIRCPKCGNSILKFVAKNPEGVDSGAIGRLLMIPEEKVEAIYEEAVQILRRDLVHEDE